MYWSLGVPVCIVCLVFDSACDFFGETIRNMFWCGCYFVVECYGCVWVEVLCWIVVHSLPRNVRVVPVIPVCI